MLGIPITTAIAVAIVLVASLATVAVGAAFKWQVTSRGYSIWMRIIGVAAVLGLAGVSAWNRRGEPSLAVTLIVGGLALAVWYVWLHVRLTRKIAASLDEDASL